MSFDNDVELRKARTVLRECWAWDLKPPKGTGVRRKTTVSV